MAQRYPLVCFVFIYIFVLFVFVSEGINLKNNYYLNMLPT